MFRLILNSRPRRPTPAMAAALMSDGLPPGMQPSTLAVVEEHGTYSGRRVNYFRVFDPIRVAERGLQIHRFTDLDRHPNLILGSGHLEHDGSVVLSKRGKPHPAETPTRSEANRSAHPDDEQIVFPTPQSE
jgi:hypothetical protein